MPVVLTLGEQDVWQCARCGRGSPDMRDEAAHLDAHRRLERDRTLLTWELLVHRLTRQDADRGERNRDPAPLILAIFAAALLGSLLLSVRAGGQLPGGAGETTAPTTTALAAPNTPPTSTRSSLPEALVGRPPASVPPVSVDARPPPSSPPAISNPLAAGPTPPTTTPTEPADRPYLLELCLPSLCLAV